MLLASCYLLPHCRVPYDCSTDIYYKFFFSLSMYYIMVELGMKLALFKILDRFSAVVAADFLKSGYLSELSHDSSKLGDERRFCNSSEGSEKYFIVYSITRSHRYIRYHKDYHHPMLLYIYIVCYLHIIGTLEIEHTYTL